MSHDQEEAETYTPEPVGIGDGEALIGDPREFFDLTQSLAAIVRDGALFVLRRDSMKWENVESIHQRKPASVAAIRGQK